jgi:hypothetical protein
MLTLLFNASPPAGTGVLKLAALFRFDKRFDKNLDIRFD